MSGEFDVTVIGLGAFGSAVAHSLAERGYSVLGLDRFQPPHDRGSSHGGSRMIREAYFEAPFYVPLVQLAYERWAALEQRSGVRLLEMTGGLVVGPEAGELVTGCLASAAEHGLAFERLTAQEVGNLYPFVPPAGAAAVLEPRAGILAPEACIEAFLRLATDAGAALRFGEPVESWELQGGTVLVRTARGEYRARRLVVCAGAWTGSLFPDLGLPLTVERTVQYWFRPTLTEPGDPDSRLTLCPVWAWEYQAGKIWYGFPDRGEGVKMGLHHGRAIPGPEALDREVGEHEIDFMRKLLGRYMPEASGPCLRTAACMYTNTPEGHFLIDRHPGHSQVWFATGGSGHGFKFASALGGLLAAAVVEEEVGFDLGHFGLGRVG